jgi:hypothetical protein
MSRRDDVIFCQIAISNGIITEDQARKALSLCDKREIEHGVRPMVGGVFTKHNLIQAQDVKRIYNAVEKRLGTSVGAGEPAAARRGPRRRPGPGRGEPRGRPAAKAARQQIDQNTLIMGIGGAVAFLVILGIIFYIVFIKEGSHEKEFRDARLVRGESPTAKETPPVEPKPKETPSAKEAVAKEAAAKEAAAKEAAAKVAAAKETPKAAPPPPPTPVRRAMTSQDLQQMKMNITDARRGDDLDHRALIGLHKLRKDNEEKGIENPPELLEFLKEFPSVPTPAEGGGSSEEKASSDSGGSDTSKEPPASESSEESTEEIK